MAIDWRYAKDAVCLSGVGTRRIDPDDAARQEHTAREILAELKNRPGLVLSDEVGMGKTYVALAVAASVILGTDGREGPVVVMMPGRLRAKWIREWEQFKRHCNLGAALAGIRHAYVHTPPEFFRLLDDRHAKRTRLIFLTTTCFARGLDDPWVKLAMIRLARGTTNLTAQMKRRLIRSARRLVRLESKRKLTDELVEKLLLRSKPAQWKSILVEANFLERTDDDPVPRNLWQCGMSGKEWWRRIKEILRTLPRSCRGDSRRMMEARREFTAACKEVYRQWLHVARWHSPLIILDEAHHAKNDDTRLAGLFRNKTVDTARTMLGNKFQRMLFLTATPFQLGHQELIRVLKSFGAVRRGGRCAPRMGKEGFDQQINELERALDENLKAARHLDRLWGQLRRQHLPDENVQTWWERIEKQPGDDWEEQLRNAARAYQGARDEAQRLLRPWVIRHNRPLHLPAASDGARQPRRQELAGAAIKDDEPQAVGGLPVAGEAALPFMLAARAQGELARLRGQRAFFAEGLASSYEAFHDTRKAAQRACDETDDGRLEHASLEDTWGQDGQQRRPLVPTRWYERQVAEFIPGRHQPAAKRRQHPKVAATVERAVHLWSAGEKVLVFCVYRETCRALYEHLRERIDQRTLQLAAEKLGGEARVEQHLDRLARRLTSRRSPLSHAMRELLELPFGDRKYATLWSRKADLVEVLLAYFRSPSFLARYVPLDDPRVRRGLIDDRPTNDDRGACVDALRESLERPWDSSQRTFFDRVRQFLDFAVELAERSEIKVETEQESADEGADPLSDMLRAVADYSQPCHAADQEGLGVDSHEGGGVRVVPIVRRVDGTVAHATRERLAMAFNSPLFPEVLVSSAVMGEGIDLHRFCRHVIHHDGCWNPSTLEQQTGRLDRIRCKAELCEMPIKVYQPYIAGSADEKMYRVLRDRQRWFQIVMGQEFRYDEATSETIADRVPLPDQLARELTFDLSRWRAS